MGLVNAFVLCNDDTRVHVGDEVKITLTTTAKEYQGYITYISDDGLRFVINGRFEFDFRIDTLEIELVARGTRCCGDETVEAYAQAADEMAAIRQAFIDKGFSKEESFILVKDLVNQSFKMARR